MCKKLIFLTSLIVVLSCFSAANAGFELKVDIAINDGGEPAPYTDKSQQEDFEDWLAWCRYGADKQNHDATHVLNIGGTGVTVGIGAGDGSSDPGTVLDFTTSADEPICNTWIRCGDEEGGPNVASVYLILSGPGLVAGTYEVYGYHNALGDDQANILPNVTAQTSYAPHGIPLDNYGPDANDPDGGGVIVEFNDVNVAVMHVTDDDLLEPNRSVVKFYTDGSPVAITYEADANSTAVLNAFILKQLGATPTAGVPFPVYEEEHACPNTILHWEPGMDANTHNVYFDPNLVDEMVIFDDDLESGDANWVPVNWTIYDSNVLEDGNNDGNSASAYHSFTPGIGLGILTTVDINTIEAGSIRVELSIRHMLGIEAGDIDLYYYNGSGWDYIADLNSTPEPEGPNDPWQRYTDDVNESEYLISNFKLQLRSNISAGEVFVDNVSVTNTWPILAEWLVYSGDANNYNPPGNLDFDTTYYWRVDEVNDGCSASPWKGYPWEFTTETGKARAPSPEDHAGFQPEAGITLGWTSSCLAASGDYLYFGTDFADVNENEVSVQFGPLFDSNHVTGALAYATKYYWKVNGIGGGLPEGDVWSFQTDGYPLMHFKFDGVLDANIGNIDDANFITDSTGNVTFNVTHGHSELGYSELRYGQANPTYNSGGTSAHFIHTEPNDDEDEGAGSRLLRSCFGPDLLDLDGTEYTIEAWVRQDGPAVGVGDNDLEGTIIRKGYGSYGLGIDDDGAVKFMHSGEHISSGDADVLLTLGEWYHIAAVYDETDPNQTEKLYINGLVVADNNSPARNPVDDYGSDHVGIGAFREDTETASLIQNYFNGAIDELRVIDIALTPGEFLIRGDPNLAWLPRPYNHAKDVQLGVDLEWYPGQYASSHDVYFGTNWDDINNVNTSNIGSYPNVDYNNVDVNIYDILYLLKLGQTYYWRVDEVNDGCDPNGWRGNIWRFTVAEYIILDDFEKYDVGYAYEQDGSWEDGGTNGTGSTIEFGDSGWGPVRGGEMSMIYWYDTWSGFGYYSEAATEALNPTDWNSPGVKMLSLWFYGDPLNDATGLEQMYVGLKDTSDLYAYVNYGDGEGEGEDMNDIQIEEWQEWNIPLSSFTDVNTADVEKLYIGFGIEGGDEEGGAGTVYFDDIRLYPPICRPEKRPTEFAELDLNDDCIIDFGDVEILADEWLETDVNLGEVKEPCDANLVGWWMFDEGDGNVAADSSTYDHNGVIETNDVWWVAGRLLPNGTPDGNALEFDGGRVRVPDTNELRPLYQVSACAWIYYSDEQDSARIVVKGADNKETFTLEVGDNDQLVFLVRDGNDYDPCDDEYEYEKYAAESNDATLDRDEWIHVAGTYDGNSVKCYINGEVADTNNDANAITYFGGWLCQDTNDLAIGNRSDSDEKPFEGTIDDVRVYDYGLSAEEVAYIASDGTKIFSVHSVANLFTNEPEGTKQAVNLKDFAKLAKGWLEKELWP